MKKYILFLFLFLTACRPGPAERVIIERTNFYRVEAGCPALTHNSRLAKAAYWHSRDMSRRGYFAHVSPEGVEPATRVTDAGYRWNGTAENIAWGDFSPAGVVDAWMNSPGHRANILNCQYKDIGIGIKNNYFTQEFGY